MPQQFLGHHDRGDNDRDNLTQQCNHGDDSVHGLLMNYGLFTTLMAQPRPKQGF